MARKWLGSKLAPRILDRSSAQLQVTVNSRLLPALNYNPLLPTTRIFWQKLNFLLSKNSPLSLTTLSRDCQKKLLPAGSKRDFTVVSSLAWEPNTSLFLPIESQQLQMKLQIFLVSKDNLQVILVFITQNCPILIFAVHQRPKVMILTRWKSYNLVNTNL